jgi:hypothetical protein
LALAFGGICPILLPLVHGRLAKLAKPTDHSTGATAGRHAPAAELSREGLDQAAAGVIVS